MTRTILPGKGATSPITADKFGGVHRDGSRAGMNNVDRQSLVRLVHNMVPTPDGKLEARRGFILWHDLPGVHSLFYHKGGFFCGAGDALYRISENGEREALLTIPATGDPIFYVAGPAGLYISSRAFNCVYDGKQARPWGTPYTDDRAEVGDGSGELVLLNTSGPPHMEHLCMAGGRILGSVGSRLHYNDPPTAYEHYRPDTFIDFPDEITMIAASREGVYVAALDATWYAPGFDPHEWQFSEAGRGALSGSLQYLARYKEFTQVPVWLSRNGLNAGVAGTVLDLSGDRVRFNGTGRAPSFYRSNAKRGQQYAANFTLPPDVGFSDSATCEVVRNGKLLP